MTKSRAAVVVVIVGLVAAGAWWRHHGHAADAPAIPIDRGSTHAGATASVPSEARHAAHAVVTVTDAKGPVAGAAVRFAGPDDEVIVVTTGADGVARRELAPGTWHVGASAIDHEPAAATPGDVHGDETVQLAIRLELGGRVLAGIVTDASGGPVVGARIDGARIGGLARPSDAVATTTTGNDGRYKLAVAAGQLLVAVSHADYAPQTRYVEVGAGATADFQLVPGGVIEGVVRDEQTKQPVAGATVEASRDSPAMLLGEVTRRNATAGADGRFRIAGLRPGSFELDARAQGRTSRAPTIVGLGVAEQVTDVELLVGKGGAIRGIVVDEAGTPVAGVEVSMFGGDHEVATDEPSNATGAFVLDGLSPGRYQLVGGRADYVTAGVTRVELGTKDVEGARVVVRRAGRVKGHVEPRQVCEVRLDFDDAMLGPQQMPMLVAPQTTGPDGEFAIGPASPIPYVLAARCPSGDQGTQPIRVTPTMAEVVLPVTAGASIAGRVVDGSGKPVAEVTVMAAPQTGSERTTIVNGMVTNGAQARTNADGTYELRGLAAATYQLQVLDRGRPEPIKTAAAATRIVLGPSDHKTGVELAIDRPDGFIRGTVTSADGKPLADAWVSVHQGLDDMLASMEGSDERIHTVTVESTGEGDDAGAIAPALTDATGHFEIGGLTRAPWTVIAEAQAGKLRGRASHVTPDATITIQAGGVTELRGTVHVTGTPPASFVVELDGPTHAESTFTWQAGAFSFGRVDPGAYTLHVTSSAGNGDTTVEVVAGQPAAADIVLAANAMVIGRISDASGNPLGGMLVTAVPDNGGPGIRVAMSGPPQTSDPDGSFRIETKAGTVAVVVMTPPSPITKRGIVAAAGKTVDAGTLIVNSGPPQPP